MLPQSAIRAEEAARYAGGAPPPPPDTGIHNKHAAPVTVPDHLGRYALSHEELAAAKK